MAAPKKKTQGTTGQVFGNNNAGPNPYRQQITQGGQNRTYGSYGLPQQASVGRQKMPSTGPHTGKPAAGYAGIPTYSQTGTRMKPTPAGSIKSVASGTKIVPKAKNTKPVSSNSKIVNKPLRNIKKK